MMTQAVVMYFLGMVVTGIIIALVYRIYFGKSEMESKIFGIWTTPGETMRILIYNLNSRVQGEIIWNKSNNNKILGATIIHDLQLTFFGWSTGTYIDPVTRHQFSFRLKLKNTGKLSLRVFDQPGRLKKQEDWRLLR